MPFDIQLNIPGIISAAFICFSFLALWFSDALFGTMMKKYRPTSTVVTLPLMMFQSIFILLFCVVMEVFVDAIGAVGMKQGVYVGIAVWLLVSLVHLAVSFKFDKNAFIVKGIYSGFFLVASVISATLLSMWR
ncbi:MAG: hypothetical protein WCW40_02885 [Bacteroidota bacterium]